MALPWQLVLKRSGEPKPAKSARKDTSTPFKRTLPCCLTSPLAVYAKTFSSSSIRDRFSKGAFRPKDYLAFRFFFPLFCSFLLFLFAAEMQHCPAVLQRKKSIQCLEHSVSITAWPCGEPENLFFFLAQLQIVLFFFHPPLLVLLSPLLLDFGTTHIQLCFLSCFFFFKFLCHVYSLSTHTVSSSSSSSPPPLSLSRSIALGLFSFYLHWRTFYVSSLLWWK